MLRYYKFDNFSFVTYGRKIGTPFLNFTYDDVFYYFFTHETKQFLFYNFNWDHKKSIWKCYSADRLRTRMSDPKKSNLGIPSCPFKV